MTKKYYLIYGNAFNEPDVMVFEELSKLKETLLKDFEDFDPQTANEDLTLEEGMFTVIYGEEVKIKKTLAFED